MLSNQILFPFYLQSYYELLEQQFFFSDSNSTHFALPNFLKKPQVQEEIFMTIILE